MKRPQLRSLFLVLLSVLATLTSASAQTPVTYTADDLLLGFRATGGAGISSNYLVNLGQASQFTAAAAAGAAPFTVLTASNNIGADLVATFGSDWHSRGDVFCGIAGTTGPLSTVGSDGPKTVYVTKMRLNPSEVIAASSRWQRGSSSNQGPVASKISAMARAFLLNDDNTPRNSTANSPKAVLQSVNDTNHYSSYQPGGTLLNSGPAPGQSFAYFVDNSVNNSIEGNPGSILELYRLAPATDSDIGAPGEYLGYFQFSDTGALTFTPAPPAGLATLAIQTAQYNVSETDVSGKAIVKVVRTGDMTKSVSVSLSTADGSAHNGVDYTGQANTTLTFGPDVTEQIVEIPLVNRSGFQGDRAFTVTISSPSTGAQLGTVATATVNILESEVSVGLQSATYSVAENAAGGKLTIAVVRAGNASNAVSVNLGTSEGTAIAGLDYTTVNTTLTFGANEMQKTVDVPIVNRTGPQGDRTFNVTLSGPTGGVTLGTASAQVTITDAVFPGSLSFSASSYQASESTIGDVQLTISVSRAGGQDGAVTVDVAAVGGTATAGTDFTLPSSPITLSWANGESGTKSFDITIKPDAAAEGAETINLALQNATGGAELGVQATAVATILDSDTTAPTVTLLTPKAGAKLTAANVEFKGNAKDAQGVARVEVKLNGVLAQTVTPASATTDFNWTVTFPPEQGSNVVEVQAFDLQNNQSTVVRRTFTFFNLRPLLAGKYNGLITAKVAGAPVDRNGLAAISVTATGSFSGKIMLSGAAFPISGVFRTDGTARFGKLQTPTFEILKKAKPANISLGHLALTLDTGFGHKVIGTLKDGTTAGAQLLAEIPHADHALYTSKKAPLAPFLNVPTAVLDLSKEKGRYTAVFQADAAPNNGIAATGFPQGDGFGIVTVSAAGVVKIVGKLADGSAVSYSNSLSKNNEWPLFVPLYGKKGLITGDVAFDSTQLETDAASPNMLWVKPENLRDKLYPAGWANGITVDFAASKYIVPAKPTTKVPTPPNPDTVLGAGATAGSIAASPNIEIALGGGGLQATTSNDAVLDSKNKVIVTGATQGETGATTLKAAFVAPTGALTGSFVHPGSSRAVVFSGVAYQKTHIAVGFFLYFPPKTAPAGTPSQGGAVSVALK